jgi:hypothetical protein
MSQELLEDILSQCESRGINPHTETVTAIRLILLCIEREREYETNLARKETGLSE